MIDELKRGFSLSSLKVAAANESKVRILENTVEKEISLDLQEVAEKYQELHELGADGGFVAPSVVAVDEFRNMLILERIHGIQSLREHYREFMLDEGKENQIVSVFERVGRVLCFIHLKLIRPGTQVWQPSCNFSSALRQYGVQGFEYTEEELVQLHCDYGFANVFTRQREKQEFEIVIIDPCCDGYTTEHDWCRGPRYVDVGKMLLSIEGKVPLYWQPRVRNRCVRLLQKAFLKGYEDIYGATLNRALCFSYAYAHGSCYFASRYPTCDRVAIALIYNRFWRKNFPLKRKLKWMNIAN